MTSAASMAPTVPLRVSVALAGLVGLLALACSQLLAPTWAVLAAAAFLAGSYASFTLPDQPAAERRKGLSVGALLLVAAFAAVNTLGGAGGIAGLTTVGPLLAALLVGVQVAHSMVLNSRRDLLVGLVVGLFMTVLAAGLSPGVVVALPLLAAWPIAVTAVVLANRLSESEAVDAVAVRHRCPDLASPRGPAASRTWPGVIVVVAVSVVLGLAIFLVLPQPAGLSARSHLLGGAVSDPSATGTTQTRSASYYTGGYLDLRARGTLPDSPVLEVPDNSPRLWRGNTLDVYDGIGWQSSDRPEQLVQAGPDFAVPLAAEDVVPPGVVLRTDTVRLRSGAATGVVVSPGPVTHVQAPAGRLFRLGAGLVLLDTAGPLGQYSVTSVPETTGPDALRAAHGADLRDQRWMQLPTTVPLRVRQLAGSIMTGARTRYDAVNAVERYLRDNETYRLDSPVPGPAEDPVDDFLFNSHQGFCEQFASAEVVLLRSRGIPARLVSGFAGGDPSPSGFRVMKASDAHAWVEVWYPGLGWSSSDPTAGARLAQPAQPSLVGRAVTAVTSFAATSGGRIVLAVLVLVLAVLAVGVARLLVVLRRRRAGRAAGAARRPAGPVLAAFLRLDEALAAHGQRGTPAETLAERAHRLPERARPAVGVLEREVYGPAPPDPEEARQAVRVFDELREGLLAAGSRR